MNSVLSPKKRKHEELNRSPTSSPKTLFNRFMLRVKGGSSPSKNNVKIECTSPIKSPYKKQKTNPDIITSSPNIKRTPDVQPATKARKILHFSLQEFEEKEKEGKTTRLMNFLFSPMLKLLTRNKGNKGNKAKSNVQLTLQTTEEFEEFPVKIDLLNNSLESSNDFTSTLDDDESTTKEDLDESEEFDPWLFIKGLPKNPPYHTGSQLLPPKKDDRPTLVLDLDETLVHCRLERVDNPDLLLTVPFSGTDYEVSVFKRPYFEEFLNSVSRHFEVVIFTASQQVYADRLLDILDKNGTITHRLFRDSCVVVQGNYLKDLSILGRSLAKTVIVDNSPHVFGYQLDNGIPIETWCADDDKDQELIKLIPFLESLISVEDVRPLVREQFKLYNKVK